MATQLQIVNNILVRLREDECATVAESSYTKLIAKFVNDAKRDLEIPNHAWSAYETEISTTILADGTLQYDLSTTNPRSWLIRDWGDERLPAAYDVTDDSWQQLYQVPLKTIRKGRAMDGDGQQVVSPDVFAIKMAADGTNWVIELMYGADNARTWKTYWYVPQANLALDGDDDDTVILLPEDPIELRALYYALNERGEEMGEPGGVAWERSVQALGAALEADGQSQRKQEGMDFTNRENI